MKRILKLSLILGFLPATLGIGLWQGWSWWTWASGPSQSVPSSKIPGKVKDKTIQVQIAPGTAVQQIGLNLEMAGVIHSVTAWNLWARWLQLHDPKGGFKAGTYFLSPTQPLSEIAQKIWTGEVMQLSFTIPEGWSLQQMAVYFEKQHFFPAQDFLAAASEVPYKQYPWLPPKLPYLEGFLYPDTYKLNSDSITPKAVVQQMLKRFEQVALPVYQEGKKQTQLNLRQWVTLASIVEKEAVRPQERARIAGVFVSRLHQGMRLETDPTVEYALGIRQTETAPLTLAQVKTPSPYNTYLNPGLPPTPIASPGLASLQAALYPEKTPYLYFVARYDGTHVFSRTLSEHRAAQAAIQKRQQQKPK